MQILAPALLTLTLVSGCKLAADESALESVLAKPMTNHAASLGGEDVPQMRRTGRILIATFDAATLRRTN